MLPLFGLAGVLMVIGYYLALTHPSPDDMGAGEAVALAQIEALEVREAALDASGQPVALRHAPAAARPMRLMLRQTSRAGQPQAQLTTQLNLDFLETIVSQAHPPASALRAAPDTLDAGASAELLGITRDYHAVSAAIFADQDQPIAAGITKQVTDLLRGAVTRAFIRPNGEMAGFDWVDVPNPQARQLLLLVRDAQVFLTPRFMTGEVNPGESWSYQRRLQVDDVASQVKAEGKVNVDNQFVGVLRQGTRRLAVVRQVLSGNTQGDLLEEDDGAQFTMQGQGEGVFLVDIAAGVLVAGDIHFVRTLRIEASAGAEPVVQSSEIIMRLRPSGELELVGNPHPTPSNTLSAPATTE